MYNYPNQFPVKQQLQDIEPLEHFQPIVFNTMSAEDRALFERILAFIRTGSGGYQEQGAIADAIQARLARG